MNIPLYIVDTFTNEKFKGNPAAVCVLHRELNEGLMQSIASELNLPVTAFIMGSLPADNYKIRYFTTTGEITACGHATLAAARVMSEIKNKPVISFSTVENRKLETRMDGGLVHMMYPKFQPQPFSISAKTLEALGLGSFKSCFFCVELETLFIELDCASQLTELNPDYKKLVASADDIKEIVVTSISGERQFDFLLRSFCPWIGIDEDPVTGSIHSVLAPFWEKRLGKSVLKARQASTRGGEVILAVQKEKVAISGHSIIILNGSLTA